jgi:hypothetical protein
VGVPRSCRARLRHRHVEITLQPLGAEDARELVANLLEVNDLPIRVRSLIIDKAEGNPFFVEEVIRTLLDRELVVRRDGHWHATQEINQIELPNTLNGVLTARLDALNESSKRVFQTAAVAGREFDYGQVAAVVDNSATLDATLLELQRRELIREKGLLRTGGHATGPAHRMYIFKYAFTQESAYESVLRGDRRDMHRTIAEFLESNRPGGISDIARHLFAASEPDRVLPYMVTAANSSAKPYATDEAIAGYRQACEIVENRGAQADPVLARQVFEGLGGTLSFSNRTNEAIETYDEMRVSAMNKTAFIYGARRGELERADKALQLSVVSGAGNDCVVSGLLGCPADVPLLPGSPTVDRNIDPSDRTGARPCHTADRIWRSRWQRGAMPGPTNERLHHHLR